MSSVRFGVHHEWGKLREVVIGISPAADFVVFHEESQRWLLPEGDRFSRAHNGRRLIDVDREWAERIERQVDALAELVAREGVTVHRPQRLAGDERTFLAPNGEGAQLFPRDGMIVIGNHMIDASSAALPTARTLWLRRSFNRSCSSAAHAGRACRWARQDASTGRSSKAAIPC